MANFRYLHFPLILIYKVRQLQRIYNFFINFMFAKEEELECLLENLATDFSQKCRVFAPKAFANMVSILVHYFFHFVYNFSIIHRNVFAKI